MESSATISAKSLRPEERAPDDPDQGQRLTEAHSENHELEEDFWKYTHTDENSDRVGEFAIGTNIGLKDVIGQILQDEKYPGVHIAFGNPYGFHTGADWYSATHIDVVGRKFNIWVDGQQIMQQGSSCWKRRACDAGALAAWSWCWCSS